MLMAICRCFKGARKSAAVERVDEIKFVDLEHEPEVFGRLRRRAMVEARAGQLEQFALPLDGEMGVGGVDPLAAILNRAGRHFF
jgi:hypothetical protein